MDEFRYSKARHRLVVLLLFVWALLFVSVVRAAAIAEFMGGYDETLLQWAAATALLGGFIRTILSLESDHRVVRDIGKTALWDAAKALVAGLLAFIAIQALRSAGWSIPAEVRFTAVLAAGWQRMAAVEWFFKTAGAWIDRKVGNDNTPPPIAKPPEENP